MPGGVAIGIVVVMVLILAIPAAALLIMMKRAPVRNHPACGACGYDVTGSIARVDRCPECGGLFTEVGVLAAHSRPRSTHRVVIVMVATLAALTITCISGSLLTAHAGRNQERAAAAAARAAAAADTARETQKHIEATKRILEIVRELEGLQPEAMPARLRAIIDEIPPPERELIVPRLERMMNLLEDDAADPRNIAPPDDDHAPDRRTAPSRGG